MRLPNGILKKLAKITKKSPQYICDIIAKRRPLTVEMAMILESACKELGLNVSKELWMFGCSKQIKTALSQHPDRRSSTDRRKCERRKSEQRECNQSEQILPAT